MSLTHPTFPESTIKAQEEFKTSLKECVKNVWHDFYENWDDSMEFNKKVKHDMYELEIVIEEMDAEIEKWTSQFKNTHKQSIVDTWNNFSKTIQELISDKMFPKNESEKFAHADTEVWLALLKDVLDIRIYAVIRVQNRIQRLIEGTPWPIFGLLDDEKPGYSQSTSKSKRDTGNPYLIGI